MKGYLFSLEALIAIIILLFPTLIININSMEFNNKKGQVYNALEILRDEEKLNQSSYRIESCMERVLDFDISVSEKCEDKRIVDYFTISERDDFKIIRICY